VAFYGFGDASGSGFGSTLVINSEIVFCHGQWVEEIEKESSNYRELTNLVFAIEEAYAAGLLSDGALFMFTDNTTAEAAFYKGTSSSQKLFDLILRLWKIQMQGGVVLHVIHIAGTQMISQGTNGLSRGSLTDGVMQGCNILSFIPLHLDPRTRDKRLTAWVISWFGAFGDYQWLEPEGRFKEGQGMGRFVWTPPPAAADVAVELLGKAKHKRPASEHIMIVPCLMTSHWQKQLSKIYDVVFTVPVGSSVWSFSQHEPLIVGISFPLSQHRPWQLRGTPMLE